MDRTEGFGEYEREMTVQEIERVDQPKDYELVEHTFNRGSGTYLIGDQGNWTVDSPAYSFDFKSRIKNG